MTHEAIASASQPANPQNSPTPKTPPAPNAPRGNLLQRVAEGLRATATSALSVVAAIAVASAALWLSGFGASSLIRALGDAFSTDFPTTVRWATPLLLTGAATALAFRARIWNIGLDGQIYVGAILAAATEPWAAKHLAPNIAVLVVLGASILGGAAFAAIPGLLRILAGAPEIVTTVILITVGQQLANYAVQGPLRSSNVALASSLITDPVNHQLWLVSLFSNSQATVGVFIALAGVAVVGFYLWKTTWGYEHVVYGENATFSLYGGVTNRAVFMRTMLLSGGLGGLVGGIEVLGVFHALQANFNPGYGFSGVAVALAARNNPLAIVIAALFFGGLRTSGSYLQLNTNAPSQFVDIVTALVILLMTARVLDRAGSRLRLPRRSRRASDVLATGTEVGLS
jgi:general nucleoside transport system permease protein